MSGSTLGHAACGGRPFTVFAAGTAERGWVGAGTAAGRLAHGVNSAGLAVGIEGDPDTPGLEGVAQRVLEQAVDVREALELLRTGASGGIPLGPAGARIWVAGGGEVCAVAREGGAGLRQPGAHSPISGLTLRRAGANRPDALLDMERRLRRAPRAATVPTRSLLAVWCDPASGPPGVFIGLGSPLSAVLLRVWPGHLVGPPAGPLGAEPSRLGSLAAQVDARVAAAALSAAAVHRALAAARRAARVEGEHADRQARLLDAQGDDAGAVVRRLVAQTYAAGLAEAALQRLLDRSSEGPSL